MSDENLSVFWLIQAQMRLQVVIPLTSTIIILLHMFVWQGNFHFLKNMNGEHLESNTFKDITMALFFVFAL